MLTQKVCTLQKVCKTEEPRIAEKYFRNTWFLLFSFTVRLKLLPRDLEIEESCICMDFKLFFWCKIRIFFYILPSLHSGTQLQAFKYRQKGL